MSREPGSRDATFDYEDQTPLKRFLFKLVDNLTVGRALLFTFSIVFCIKSILSHLQMDNINNGMTQEQILEDLRISQARNEQMQQQFPDMISTKNEKRNSLIIFSVTLILIFGIFQYMNIRQAYREKKEKSDQNKQANQDQTREQLTDSLSKFLIQLTISKLQSVSSTLINKLQQMLTARTVRGLNKKTKFTKIQNRVVLDPDFSDKFMEIEFKLQETDYTSQEYLNEFLTLSVQAVEYYDIHQEEKSQFFAQKMNWVLQKYHKQLDRQEQQKKFTTFGRYSNIGKFGSKNKGSRLSTSGQLQASNMHKSGSTNSLFFSSSAIERLDQERGILSERKNPVPSIQNLDSVSYQNMDKENIGDTENTIEKNDSNSNCSKTIKSQKYEQATKQKSYQQLFYEQCQENMQKLKKQEESQISHNQLIKSHLDLQNERIVHKIVERERSKKLNTSQSSGSFSVYSGFNYNIEKEHRRLNKHGHSKSFKRLYINENEEIFSENQAEMNKQPMISKYFSNQIQEGNNILNQSSYIDRRSPEGLLNQSMCSKVQYASNTVNKFKVQPILGINKANEQTHQQRFSLKDPKNQLDLSTQ